MIGKWHLGFCNKKFWPQSRGFDTFYGYLTGHEGYYDHSHDGGYDFRDGDQVAVEANGTYSTQLMAQRAAAVIRDHDPAAPLFLYVAFQSVQKIFFIRSQKYFVLAWRCACWWSEQHRAGEMLQLDI